MSGQGSRHKGLATYARAPSGGGAPVELYQPRITPRTEQALLHRVTAGDRLDLLASRYYGDPLQYWRIADANPARLPEDLLEVGRVLVIPRGD